MIKKIIEVSQPGTFLSVRLGQLLVQRDRQLIGQVPCEDIGVLLIDHTGVSYTHSVFTTLLQHGAAIVLCNGQHHPAGIVLPMEGNCVQTQRYRLQLDTKEPIKKRLWQQIVQTKIRHQANVIAEDEQTKKFLLSLATKVRSGDPDNCEAQASRRYWRAFLQHIDFKRQRNGVWPNALLNYGYMVLRAAVARAICSAGLLPAIGLHHRNKYNAFCLADDIVEPFRGYVEAKVKSIEPQKMAMDSLTQPLKAMMLEILYQDVSIGGLQGPLMVGLHRTAASLVRCLAEEQKQLDLPDL